MKQLVVQQIVFGIVLLQVVGMMEGVQTKQIGRIAVVMGIVRLAVVVATREIVVIGHMLMVVILLVIVFGLEVVRATMDVPVLPTTKVVAKAMATAHSRQQIVRLKATVMVMEPALLQTLAPAPPTMTQLTVALLVLITLI